MIKKVKCLLGLHQLEKKTRYGVVNSVSLSVDYHQCKNCNKQIKMSKQPNTKLGNYIIIVLILIVIAQLIYVAVSLA